MLSDCWCLSLSFSADEVCLSPVVMVGGCAGEGAAVSLRRPVVVSARHCASTFPRDNWTFSVWTDEGSGWKRVNTIQIQ